MAFRMPAPLDQLSPDPTAFMLEAVKRFRRPFIDTVNRTAARLGKTAFDVHEGGDPSRKITHRIPLQATTSTPDATIALQFATLGLMNVGALVDEARRVALNQPHGLEGDVGFEGRFPTQRELSLFGIDDAVIVGFLGVMVAFAPLLAIVIPIVLPALISLVQSIAPGFLNPAPPPGEGGETATGTVTVSKGLLETMSDPVVLGGIVLGLFLLLR